MTDPLLDERSLVGNNRRKRFNAVTFHNRLHQKLVLLAFAVLIWRQGRLEKCHCGSPEWRRDEVQADGEGGGMLRNQNDTGQGDAHRADNTACARPACTLPLEQGEM